MRRRATSAYDTAMRATLAPAPSVPPTPFADASGPGPKVRGVVHRPAGVPADGLVLTHGAGSSAAAPLLVGLAEAFARAGLTVLRCDLPFRQARATGPPSPAGASTDREGLRRALGAMRALVPGRLFLGGHSYGGRQASLLAAEDPEVADRLLLLAYPLHPPRQPTRLRTAHFPRLRTPAFFAHGSRDPFGTLPELAAAITAIAAPTRLLAIEGQAHALAARRRAVAGEPIGAIVEEFLSFARDHADGARDAPSVQW
jgi:uncharacterized protein